MAAASTIIAGIGAAVAAGTAVSQADSARKARHAQEDQIKATKLAEEQAAAEEKNAVAKETLRRKQGARASSLLASDQPATQLKTVLGG